MHWDICFSRGSLLPSAIMPQALRCRVTLHYCTSTHFREKQSKANIYFFFHIFGRLECVHAEEKLPMRRRDCRHLCDAMPCSPWSADTENSLSLLLSLLHTGRIENRGRGAELNPNIPSWVVCFAYWGKGPLCDRENNEKNKNTLTSSSPFFLFISHLFCRLGSCFPSHIYICVAGNPW